MNDILTIGNKQFTNRLFTGSGKYENSEIIPEVLKQSGAEVITVAVRRMDFSKKQNNILNYIPADTTLLVNTSGAQNAEEALRIAQIAREAGYGNFIKIEIITESKYLMPDNEETIKAIKLLHKEGFITLPYMMPDIISAKKMEDAGADGIMPLGSPIGSGQGLLSKEFIRIIMEYTSLPVLVDAGIGVPSHAAEAMEMGAAAVLANTAIACSENPVTMARAFSLAVQAGRMAYLSGRSSIQQYAEPSSPLTGFLHD